MSRFRQVLVFLILLVFLELQPGHLGYRAAAFQVKIRSRLGGVIILERLWLLGAPGRSELR